MPYTTYANQKSIRIHKPAVSRDFLQIDNKEWMAVNKQLGPYCLQLYLYLAANADGFNLELSPQHAENDAGIRRTTFYEYMIFKICIEVELVARRHADQPRQACLACQLAEPVLTPIRFAG